MVVQIHYLENTVIEEEVEIKEKPENNIIKRKN